MPSLRRKLFHRSLSTRLVLFVGIPSALFLTAIIAWIGYRDFHFAVEYTRMQAINLANLEAVRLDGVLSSAAHIPESHAALLENDTLTTPEEIQIHLLNTLERYRGLIYGSCLAFEPGQFTPGVTHYAPYVYWNNGAPEYRNLVPPEYDHFQWDWYNIPKKTGKALWTEPFYDEGGGNVLMTTRTYPLFRKFADPTNPGGKVFWGVATIDIELHALVASLAAIKVAQTGYAILISQQGRILSHPDRSQIFVSNISDVFPQLHEHLGSYEQGFVRLLNPWRENEDSWIAFTKIQNGGFTLALIYPLHEVIAPAIRSLLEFILFSLLGIIGLFIALALMSRSVTRPISELSVAAGKIANGDLNHPLDLNISFREGRQLAQAFEKMSNDLRTRMQELQDTSASKARLTGELNAARRIQTSMLPGKWSTQSSWPQHSRISLDAIMQPAREIGGDFYDHRFLDDHRLSILIGDVSGKGVPAALFMAMTQTLFKGYRGPDINPASVLEHVNEALCNETHTGMFVTLVYAVLDIRTHTLELCNAGHAAPLLISSRGEVQPMTSERHPALGLLRKHSFTSTTFKLEYGDKLFFYTDGVTEAFNPEHEQFGGERLIGLLCQQHQLPVEQLTQQVLQAVHQHSDNQENSDDITVLAVQIKPDPSR